MRYFIKCLKMYANPLGRASRAEYWNFMLFHLLINYLTALIGILIRLPELNIIYTFLMILPGLSVGMRRMHDIDRVGAFYLIPGCNLVLAALQGSSRSNAYGPNPKNV